MATNNEEFFGRDFIDGRKFKRLFTSPCIQLRDQIATLNKALNLKIISLPMQMRDNEDWLACFIHDILTMPRELVIARFVKDGGIVAS